MQSNLRTLSILSSLLVIEALRGVLVRADDTLPYALRTQPYCGYSTATRGDIRTVGMAGATVGLGDTFIAAGDNPAGLAMTLKTGDDNLTSNRIKDAHVQEFDRPIEVGSFGVALAPYPWGVSFGRVTTYRESNVYVVPGNTTVNTPINVSTKEYRFSAARFFERPKMSLGVGIRMGTMNQTLGDGERAAYHKSQGDIGWGATLGAQWRLPRRFVLGISYSTPMKYTVESDIAHQGVFPGFFQDVQVPYRFGAGLGWIPNRFIRMDVSTFLVGPTQNTALLRDQSRLVGTEFTVHPRAGIAYVFMDFDELRGTAFAGSYYEASRIRGYRDRIHATGGIELKVWLVNFGFGMDRAKHYENVLVSIGIDPFKLMRKLDIIPTTDFEPRGGFFPKPDMLSEVGLARPMVDDWKPLGPSINPVDVGLKIPEKIKERVEDAAEQKAVGKDIIEAIGSIPSKIGNEFKSMKKVEEDIARKRAEQSPKPTPKPASKPKNKR